MAKKKIGILREPFGTSYLAKPEVSDEYTVVDPHPEPPPPPRAKPAGLGPDVPLPAQIEGLRGTLTPLGLDNLYQHWSWKLTQAKCPRCGGPRFVSIHDIGAGFGPPGCQVGICGACGADLKLTRPKRRRLSTWEGP